MYIYIYTHTYPYTLASISINWSTGWARPARRMGLGATEVPPRSS